MPFNKINDPANYGSKTLLLYTVANQNAGCRVLGGNQSKVSLAANGFTLS
jgi:hypothetical protein